MIKTKNNFKKNTIKIAVFLIGLIGNVFADIILATQHNEIIPPKEIIPEKIFLISSYLKIYKLAKDIYIVRDNEAWPANSMLVKMSNNAVLMVDTPYTPEATREVVKWIDNKFSHPKITVINTHYHVDRLGGNQYLLTQHIPIYGSDLTNKLIVREKQKNFKKELITALNNPKLMKKYNLTDKSLLRQTSKRFDRMVFMSPDHLFPLQKGIKLNIGGKNIFVFYPGPAHTRDNVMVFIPHFKLLFGGCAIVALPFIHVGEANLAAWPRSLNNIDLFLKKHNYSYNQIKWVIPGHPAPYPAAGFEFSPDLLQHTISLL